MNSSVLTWEEYENEVFELSKIYYPEAKVQKNVKRKGKFSKINRQIDVLIEQEIGGNVATIVIDCKLYNKKVDVKAVESFISMVEDLEADKGLLVSEKGYSKAALNRAYYNIKHIELDILSLKELKSNFHGELAFPYSGENGIILFAPFGWIIDAEKREGSVCMLYQRGLTLAEAASQKELAYLNFWDRKEDGFNLEKLIKHQEKYMRNEKEIISIEYKKGILRIDGRSKIRIMKVKNYPSIEVTGFLEFDNFIVFIVWFSVETSIKRTISKLEILLKNTIPISIDQNSILESDLKALNELLDQESDDIAKANIYIEQAETLIKHRKHDSAIEKLDESIKLVNNNYGAIKLKVDIYLILKKSIDNINKILNDFCELDPTNPIIGNDLIDLFYKHGREKELINIFKKKIKDYNGHDQAQGNFSFYLGLLYLNMKRNDKARKHFVKSKVMFLNSVSSDHQVFETIENALKKC